MKLKLRTSSSIINFREKAEKSLGLERYNWKIDGYDVPVVFLGLYHKNDYDSFTRPRIKRYVLWSGGDIQNLKRGYLYGDGGGLWKSKIARFIPFWKRIIIKTKAEHFCENYQQKKELENLGIRAKIIPAFWGDMNDFPVSFKEKIPLNIYICGHPGREKEYGWDTAKKLAEEFPDDLFHFYGSEIIEKRKNIISHGIISEEQFNKEIKKYQCLLRLNEHDGFSDVLAKSILMGQYPISKVVHNLVIGYKEFSDLKKFIEWIKEQKRPFLEAREYYLKNFNNYPFLNGKMDDSSAS
jgi:hypothetical protein